MSVAQAEITLEISPQNRLDVIDVNALVRRREPGFFRTFPKAAYFSYHTTAGYFEQRLCERLNHCEQSVRSFVESFQRLFPPQADYRHDQLHLRNELSEAQRRVEPQNGDSHLTFIGAGLANCVTYVTDPSKPAYLVDLDGVYREVRRRRRTTIVGFSKEVAVARIQIEVPVSAHSIDSVSLKDSRLAVFGVLTELVRRHGVQRGRLDLSLSAQEQHAGLTVNEYETLLMKHDLAEVLWNPLRFMAEKGRHMLQDPRAIPGKAKDYFKYDVVRFLNEFLDHFGLSESVLERIVNRLMAVPAARFLRMKRSVSLLVADPETNRSGKLLEGSYQSPVLVQWRKPEQPRRLLNVTLFRFE